MTKTRWKFPAWKFRRRLIRGGRRRRRPCCVTSSSTRLWNVSTWPPTRLADITTSRHITSQAPVIITTAAVQMSFRASLDTMRCGRASSTIETSPATSSRSSRLFHSVNRLALRLIVTLVIPSSSQLFLLTCFTSSLEPAFYIAQNS